MIKKIGILTGGGDCPGLNAVIRAVVRTASTELESKVIGFRDGYEGLITDNFLELGSRDVSGILTLGGTILGTSNVANPYNYAVEEKNGNLVYKDFSGKAIANYKKHGLNALIVAGGDGTMAIAAKLIADGLKIVAVPKTIDNDLPQTEQTFGFDSALVTATEAIDKLHSTAQSHHRVMVIEVMGRYAGWLALYSGIAGGGDVILIPEIPYKIENVCDTLMKRLKQGKRFSIVVVAEGAKPVGGNFSVAQIVEKSTDKIRLGGIANKVAEEIENRILLETRATVLGHVQRGGTPTPFDRILATRFGASAVRMVKEKKFGSMCALKCGNITEVAISKVVGRLKLVQPDSELIKQVKAMGVSFGD
jgi:6-phosphofructokinase 1